MKIQVNVPGTASIGSEVLVRTSKGEKVGTVVSLSTDLKGTVAVLEIDSDSSVAEEIRRPAPGFISMGVAEGE